MPGTLQRWGKTQQIFPEYCVPAGNSCRKVLKYLLAFDEESKRKLLNVMSAHSFIKNNNVYDLGLNISCIDA